MQVTGDGNVAGAAMRFALRHRVLLSSAALSALCVWTVGDAARAALGGAPLLEAALILAGAALAAVSLLFYTRHWALALLTAAAPLPGLTWAAPTGAGDAFGAVPLLAYVFAYAVAVVLAHNVLVRTLDSGVVEHPFKPAGAAVALMSAMALSWFWRTPAGAAAYQAVLDAVLAVVSTLIVMPIGAAFLQFDEVFVAVANRARERRQRLFEKIGVVTMPRWGMSIAGIALIFIALAGFGAEPALFSKHFGSVFAASLGLAFAFSVVVCGGWREGLGVTVAAGLAGLMALWAFAEIRNVAQASRVGVMEIMSLTFFLAFCSARRAAKYRRLGDDPSVARLRAVEDLGGPQLIAVLGGIAAVLPSVVVHHAYAAYPVALAFAGAGAVGFAPALATACAALLPRRRSVEELYGRD
ncbi:MAG: hypothetical protein KGM97_05410 [Alphaproteobacteria bacterium]|nr:hypothetical protein [Alphaproteobacteria bacterium]MDE2630410.1 hypothetical protein [Alphaproteobacteria bacterium]